MKFTECPERGCNWKVASEPTADRQLRDHVRWMHPQRKLRDGDQPMPVPNNRPDVQSLVVADIQERRRVGISRYGTALQAHNGRDALRDAYEEAIDLAMYLRQLLEERKP